MLRIKWLLIIFLLIATPSFAQNTINIGIPVKLFDATTATIQNSVSFALPSLQTQCTWQSIFAVTPASVTLQLQISNDNTTFSIADTSTSVTSESRTVNFSSGFVRARINAISGGSGITVSINCKTWNGGSGSLPSNGDTQILFNNTGAISGNAGFTYDTSSGSVNLDNSFDLSGSGIPLNVNADQAGVTGSFSLSPSASYSNGDVLILGIQPSAGTYTNLRGISINSIGSGASNTYGILIADQTKGSISNYAIKTGLGKISFGDSISTGGSTPSVANVGASSCGTTTATIAGNDNSGFITVGATSGTQCRITFVSTAPTARECTANDETTTTAVRVTYVDTTHTDFIGAFIAGDKVSYICFAR